ncbi:MAG: FHA domain-containing protein [Chloroflexi bacterium]|nr:FHA domain-containing protein [Chloroflexota bacterium]
MPYRLIVHGGLAHGRVVDLTGVITIGRDASNVLVLGGDGYVSGYHARIEPYGDQVVVTDLGSANGTFVNGQRIVGPAQLRPGDYVQIGTTTLGLEPLVLPPPQAGAYGQPGYGAPGGYAAPGYGQPWPGQVAGPPGGYANQPTAGTPPWIGYPPGFQTGPPVVVVQAASPQSGTSPVVFCAGCLVVFVLFWLLCFICNLIGGFASLLPLLVVPT